MSLLARLRQADYLDVAVMALCAAALIPPIIALGPLQRLMEPGDSLLFGPTLNGIKLMVVPVAIFIVPATVALWGIFTPWIRQILRKPAPPLPPSLLIPPPMPAWAKGTTGRTVGTIFAVALLVVAAKGFTSYFYVDQRGLSVRPAFELALRRYDWANVVAVTILCQPTAKGRPRFNYVLEMSDGYEIELTLAPMHRFAASLPVVSSLLRSSPNVRYRFDVSEASLAALGKEHGVALANSIREQVSIHGGSLER